MITWDYRIFKEDNGDYIIREVFYDEEGCIIGCTEEGVEPFGHSLEDLAEQLEAFKKALTLPVLTLADIPLKKEEKKRQKEGQNISHEELVIELDLR
jgi:hypothetical protein